MRLSIISLFTLIGSSAAFSPSVGSNGRTCVAQKSTAAEDVESITKEKQNSAVDELVRISEMSNPLLKFYDPSNLHEIEIFDNTNEQSIAFLRHAEIKHGRVAMAAFVGYCAQANGLHFPWKMTLEGMNFPYESLNPPEQWDAIPDVAKWQIILIVGFLEAFSEAAGPHYMRGGKPGAFPNFSDYPDFMPHPVPFNLYDPFRFNKKRSDAWKEKGLIKELNNGRLAMFGIMGCLAEQKVEGAVPVLKGLLPHYDGQVMAPFEF